MLTRADLQRDGFLSMFKSGDLHAFGWQIIHWMQPATKQYVIEYVERLPGGRAGLSIIVTNYDEQAAFHRRIGANVVPPGERYDGQAEGIEQPWLF